MPDKLYNAFNALNILKKNKELYIPGLLGTLIGGNEQVEVNNRPGYVYVRIHNNFSEVVQVYNDQVSPVYGLPVLIIRDNIDATRYRIYGRDIGAYENWQSDTNYLPIHGNQHSFNSDNFGGGDIVWVYDRQIMPLLVYPSGTTGAGMVMIAPDLIWHNSEWRAVGGTGTASLLSYKPTGSTSSLVLISLDSVGNPKTTLASYAIPTGTVSGESLLQYLPDPANYDIPLAMVRLSSGTSAIPWDNIYDLRGFSCENITGSSGGGGDPFIQATYLVVTGSASLDNYRVVTAGTGITLQDNGPGAELIIRGSFISGTSSGVVWETQQYTTGDLLAYTTYGRYVATQSVTLKKVTVYFYSGDDGSTDWRIYLAPSNLDSWTTTHDETYVTITRTLDTSLVAGNKVEVMTYTNVGLYSGPVMIIFEIER
jgi:hypothetical protein